MRALTTITLGLAMYAMLACTPAFNWREVRIAATPLHALFPCKPEKESRKVTMAGLETELHMAHCDASGVKAAVGHARIADATLIQAALVQWKAATLAGMRVTPAMVSGPVGSPAPVAAGALSVDAAGTTPDGKPLRLKATWFARDGEVYAALWYGQSWSSELAESFFSGLQFR